MGSMAAPLWALESCVWVFCIDITLLLHSVSLYSLSLGICLVRVLTDSWAQSPTARLPHGSELCLGLSAAWSEFECGAQVQKLRV